jgi:hypothetical protein
MDSMITLPIGILADSACHFPRVAVPYRIEADPTLPGMAITEAV